MAPGILDGRKYLADHCYVISGIENNSFLIKCHTLSTHFLFKIAKVDYMWQWALLLFQ